MKTKNLNERRRLRRGAARLFFVFALLTVACAASSTPLLIEHFDEDVPDYSPIGNAPGWHVLALKGGVVADFTTSFPGYKYEYPALSHLEGGARSGPGRWSPGFLTLIGNVVSNALIWMETPTNFQGQAITGFSYYSRHDSAAASTRIVVRADGQWYASATSVHDSGAPADWVLNTLRFTTAAEAWQELNTNDLTLGSRLSHPLAKHDISAVGFFCLTAGGSRMRLDEFRVVTGPVWDQDYSVGSWIWAAQRKDRITCRFWKLIEIPNGVRVKRARLRMTAHDTFRAFLDGTEFGRGSDWGRLTEYDVTRVLSPGRHVLAVEAFNEYEWAGLVAGLVVELADGEVIKIRSDDTWRIVPAEAKDWLTTVGPEESWPAATTLFPFRDAPGIPESPKVDSSLPLQPVVIQFWQRGWFQVTLLSFCACRGGDLPAAAGQSDHAVEGAKDSAAGASPDCAGHS